MRKAVVYARYSCDGQNEQSIEGQLRVCREFAERNDILILDTYIDRAMTGTNDLRPVFQKMLSDSDHSDWDIVLVYALDRFGRNSTDVAINKYRLKKNNKILLSATEITSTNVDGTTNLGGILLENVLIGVAEYYSVELRQKVNRGLRESWSKGQTTGGREIFGYDVVNKRCIVNEAEAAIVIELFSKYAQGYTVTSIERIFRDKGYRRKSGDVLRERFLYRLLHDKRYIGIVEHQGVVYDKIFPRIVPEELWQAVSEIAEDNKLAPSRKKEIFDFILSGKLICGNCKRRMIGVSGRSKTGEIHYYYACQSKQKIRVKCRTKPIRKQALEDLVINLTIKLLRQTSNIHKIAEAIYKMHKDDVADNAALKVLEHNRKEAVRAQNNIIKAIEQGIITEATKSRLSELEISIAQIDIEINKEKARNYSSLTVEDIEEYLNQFVFEDTSDIEVRKLIVKTFIREVILFDKKIIVDYNFIDAPNCTKVSKDAVLKTEELIESSKDVFWGAESSSKLTLSPPSKLSRTFG